jgi:carbon storage regulator
MLVLTRRAKESIRIAGRIRVTLLGIKRGQARVGIEAPDNIAVDREEIYLRKQEEQKRRSGQ